MNTAHLKQKGHLQNLTKTEKKKLPKKKVSKGPQM